MKKIIFSLAAICLMSTVSYANNNQKTTEKSKKEVIVTEIQKYVKVTELGVEKEILNTIVSDETLRIPWVYVAWFIELHYNQGFSAEDAHNFANGIQGMADMGTVVWP